MVPATREQRISDLRRLARLSSSFQLGRVELGWRVREFREFPLNVNDRSTRTPGEGRLFFPASIFYRVSRPQRRVRRVVCHAPSDLHNYSEYCLLTACRTWRPRVRGRRRTVELLRRKSAARESTRFTLAVQICISGHCEYEASRDRQREKEREKERVCVCFQREERDEGARSGKRERRENTLPT